ncbi:hypothetical protein P8935_14105 [Telmatobacter sp. DSM 110680]|uniref:Uncharacterized protein n=1 Tax=Telmatobacter sp. DSM 110680 TaxID=3036704 RepID=A0AAU7DEX6_9BACT
MVNDLEIESSRDVSQAVRRDFAHKLSHQFLRKLFFTALILSILNFALFFAGTFYLGGNAIRGKIEADRYYVWGYHHGVKGYAEVSHAAFIYSEWHGDSVIVTWPLMILACFIYEKMRRRGED